MNILSLFDGMSCLRIALYRLNIPVTTYFASEIDKPAIQVSKDNWFDINHIGDVTKVESYMLPQIDLLAGGSSCQGFSFAGKGLNFEDPRSKLFFEFVRLKKECNPKWFFLENVRMKKEHQKVISDLLGVEPILIDSALVSAQHRKRLYWTNIPYFGLPGDRGIVLNDILEYSTDVIEEKSLCLSAGYRNNPSIRGYEKSQKQLIRVGNVHPSGKGMNGKVYDSSGKAPSLTTNKGEGSKIRISGISIAENGNIRPFKDDGHKGSLSEYGTISHPDNKSCAVTAKHSPKVLGLASDLKGFEQNRRIYSPEAKALPLPGHPHTRPKIMLDFEAYSDICKNQINKNAKQGYEKSNSLGTGSAPTNIGTAVLKIEQRSRGFNKGGFHESKSPPITSNSWQENNKLTDGKFYYRKLTPVECERLQTVPDNYTSCVSNTQRYKMLGNGWNVETIVHLLKPLTMIEWI